MDTNNKCLKSDYQVHSRFILIRYSQKSQKIDCHFKKRRNIKELISNLYIQIYLIFYLVNGGRWDRLKRKRNYKSSVQVLQSRNHSLFKLLYLINFNINQIEEKSKIKSNNNDPLGSSIAFKK